MLEAGFEQFVHGCGGEGGAVVGGEEGGALALLQASAREAALAARDKVLSAKAVVGRAVERDAPAPTSSSKAMLATSQSAASLGSRRRGSTIADLVIAQRPDLAIRANFAAPERHRLCALGVVAVWTCRIWHEAWLASARREAGG